MTQQTPSAPLLSDPPWPHDLLWLTRADALWSDRPQPEWVPEAMVQAAVVVVRRARPIGGRIPVGVRGRSRSERFPAAVAPDGVRRRVRPEDLLARQDWRGTERGGTMAALRALGWLAHAWDGLEWPWGPTGSAGFELATGVPALTSESDLDLVIRVREPLSNLAAQLLLKTVLRLETAVDAQIETPLGSVALREVASPSGPRVLLKTSDGPRLVMDPWSPEEGASL
jgi:phosphoribosyl-dephospho-CoA transferase